VPNRATMVPSPMTDEFDSVERDRAPQMPQISPPHC
jgi:hypothetical protein